MFNRKSTILLITLVVVSMVALVGCAAEQPSTAFEGSDFVQVEWAEINPPPGQDGPCYAFFGQKSGMYHGFGFAGVICP